MNTSVSDFNADQINSVQNIVDQRFAEVIELQVGDAEIQLDPEQLELVICPVIYWNARECNFLIIKSGDEEYRAQYFYNPRNQLNTSQRTFNTIEDSVWAVLREQADHERETAMAKDKQAGEVGTD